MPLLQIGEYRPDVADYEAQATKSILNVIPRGDGYGPFPAAQEFSQAIAAPCRGAFYALNDDGSVTTFAGTSNRLYKMSNTNLSWGDVSKGGVAYTDLSSDAQWQFAQTGSLVWATQRNAPLQVFDLASPSTFVDALGSPPQASYISVVGRFLVLSGLDSAPFRIQWSGLNNFNAADSWTSGVGGSDFQDFPDGGIVRGVAGGEYGIIFQDQAIRRMSYVPGSPIIFQIDRIAQDKGLYAPYSIVRAGENILFYSSQGFQKIAPGGYPEPIGREKVDRTFIADLDKGSLQLFIGASDPRSPRVYWAYKSVNGTTGLFDKILGYDILLDRFFPLSVSGEYLLGISQTGLTLESLDSISGSIDALTISLDAYATAVQPEIAQFDSSHKLSFFRGSNLEATLETGEQGTDERTITVRGFRPVTDSASVFGLVSHRLTQGQASNDDAEVSISSRTGRIDPQIRDTRYARMRLRIPSGTTWTYFAGVVPDFVQTGQL
ncbi:hypothetical protein JQ628_11320 [Bradyrhizobium lablabi]|uniref:hypothetical protein n=1 Tax=Bradyrhizobium lablabi TaxID=722472 RepID=UPI001BAC926C|nr:hypothetical protein [Bradyrhizobium lablabi]MBR1122106.1 hypothetical protein [Bradyrhizobium lablabi]